MTTLGRSIINSRITNCRLRQARQDGLPLTESIRSSGSAPASWSSAGWETSILVSVMPRQGDQEAPPICTGSPQRRWAFASSQWRTHGLFKARLLRPNANNGDKQSNNNNASNQFFQLLDAMGMRGLTQWSNRQEVEFSPNGTPVIHSNFYYPRFRPEVFAEKLIAISNEVKPPWFIVVYGGGPYWFNEVAERLPKDKFKAVKLDEFFEAARQARPQVEGRTWIPPKEAAKP